MSVWQRFPQTLLFYLKWQNMTSLWRYSLPTYHRCEICLWSTCGELMKEGVSENFVALFFSVCKLLENSHLFCCWCVILQQLDEMSHTVRFLLPYSPALIVSRPNRNRCTVQGQNERMKPARFLVQWTECAKFNVLCVFSNFLPVQVCWRFRDRFEAKSAVVLYSIHFIELHPLLETVVPSFEAHASTLNVEHLADELQYSFRSRSRDESFPPKVLHQHIHVWEHGKCTWAAAAIKDIRLCFWWWRGVGRRMVGWNGTGH